MSTPESSALTPFVWLRRFTKLVVAATLYLIFMGAQVKSHEAGLSVPDWPNTYGQNMFLFPPSQWVGGIGYEHTHRLFASLVGFLSIITAVWLTIRDPRHWVRGLAYGALALVIIQGIFGGITVLLLLPAPVSTLHALFAQAFLMLTIIVAYTQSKEHRTRIETGKSEPPNPVLKPALWVVAAVYIQLLLGAFMRHTEAGLAIPDFPTTGGRWFPVFNEATLAWINQWRFDYSFEAGGVGLEPVTMGQVLIHFAHRLGAVFVLTTVVIATRAACRVRKELPKVWRAALLLDGVVVYQLVLGMYVVWSHKEPLHTSSHVVTGAAILGIATLLALRAWPLNPVHEKLEENDPEERELEAQTNA